MLLPPEIYENRIELNIGDWLYVVPESDSVVAEMMEVTDVSAGRFVCGDYDLSCTRAFGRVGRSMAANAYSSLAAYWAVQIIPNLGWTAHERRKDVFYRIYTNAKVTPHIKRVAFLQIDHYDGDLVFAGRYLGEGRNMLADFSERFSVNQNDCNAATKISNCLAYADDIIRASYAMNVTRDSAVGPSQIS
jgi:hypothetical protein